MSVGKHPAKVELKRQAMKAAIERYNVVAFNEPPPVEDCGLDLALEVYDEVMFGTEPGEMSRALAALEGDSEGENDSALGSPSFNSSYRADLIARSAKVK